MQHVQNYFTCHCSVDAYYLYDIHIELGDLKSIWSIENKIVSTYYILSYMWDLASLDFGI